MFTTFGGCYFEENDMMRLQICENNNSMKISAQKLPTIKEFMLMFIKAYRKLKKSRMKEEVISFQLLL